MKYKISGIIDAELTTLGNARPEYIKPLIDGGCKELAKEMPRERVFKIQDTTRFYKSTVIGKYLRPAESSMDRILIELEDLTAKIDKLSEFFVTHVFLHELEEDMRSLLKRQFDVMVEYRKILEKRIELMQK